MRVRSFLAGVLLAAAAPVGLTAVLALATPAFAAEPPAAPAAAPTAEKAPELPVERYVLDNGLEVLLSRDTRVPLVAVNLWYHVGAKNEVPGRSGFAHLFEHIMFQGSRNVAEDTFFQYLEGAGAPLVNGTTDFDRTNYFETVPANQLELALWLESDRMGFLLDTLTQERLDNQKAVVRKERQQSTENVPYGVAEERFFQLLFPAPHPYNGVVIGSHKDLEAATLEDVKGFFKTFYTPNNATIAIVGDYDPATIKPLVQKYFGSLPKAAEPPALAVKTEPITSERRIALTDEVELPKVVFGWVTPNAFQPGDAELTFAASVLAEGKSSRLYTELVAKQQIAQSVNAYQYPLTLGSVFAVEILGKPGQTPEALEKAAWTVIEGLRAAPPSGDEVARALRTWQASTLRGLESLGGFGGKADVLNYYNHHLGDPGWLPKDFLRMQAVTPASVQKVFAEQIKADNRVVVHVTPVPAATDAGGVK
ncbi:MAG: pitrilysin family protein [Pseudomonadota bacterium]|nr:pitrilysin family protein [Pseudomonadota bacterium]